MKSAKNAGSATPKRSIYITKCDYKYFYFEFLEVYMKESNIFTKQKIHIILINISYYFDIYYLTFIFELIYYKVSSSFIALYHQIMNKIHNL